MTSENMLCQSRKTHGTKFSDCTQESTQSVSHWSYFDGKGKECAIPKESVLKRLRSVRAPAKCETEKL